MDIDNITIGEILKTLTRKGKKLFLLPDSEFEQLLRDNEWKWDADNNIVDKDGNLVTDEMLEAAV